MALVLDDTLAGANSNTYISLINANTYFDARLHTTAWTDALTDDIRNRALAMATKRIDQETFYGTRSTDIQKLAFPRDGLGDLDSVELDGIIPEMLKDATCELAIYMISNDMSKPSVDTSNMSEVAVGSIKVKYAIDKNDNVSQSYDTLPPFVLSLLDDLSRTVSSGGIIDIGR